MSDPLPALLDTERYYSIPDLLSMSAEDVEELWSACPTPQLFQDAIEQRLIQTFGSDALITDAGRIEVVDGLLELAGQPQPILPFGYGSAYEVLWAKAPQRVVRHLAEGVPLAQRPAALARQRIPRPVLLAIILISLVCLLGMVFNQAVIQPQARSAALTATALALLPDTTATPTPLALEAIDRPIGGGDDLRTRYPVILEIQRGDGPALVFPVQQKEVQIAEWDYARDSDVASSVLGLAIKPALGIPFTASHLAYLSALVPGDAIRLKMNTGQVIHYVVDSSQRVSRQDTALFGQTAPGITIVLLDDPAPDRLVILGSYIEPSGAHVEGANSALVMAGSPHVFTASGIALSVESAVASDGGANKPLPADWTYLLVDIKLNASAPVSTADLIFTLVDASSGTTYQAAQLNPALTANPLLAPRQLTPGQPTTVTIGFLIPRSLGTPELVVRTGSDSATFVLPVTTLTPASINDLQVIVLKAATTGTRTTPGELVVTARLYNPTSQAITLDSRNLSVITMPALAPASGLAEGQFPVGPANPPRAPALPITVDTGQSLDIELHFVWSGDAVAGLTIGGYRYILTLAQP